jgi:drug/metabolite transporter (DMT)-like permease
VTRSTAALVLLAATFFWGVTFPVVKGAIAHVGVFVFLSQRFVGAFVLLVLIASRRGRLPDRATLTRGVTLGVVLFAIYAFQTVGLRFTSASNSAFLTGLGVVIVPVIAALLLHERAGALLWAAVGLAAAGLLLMTTAGRLEAGFNPGDLLSVACALCVAVHIILSSRFAPRRDAAWLAAAQIGVVALGCLAVAALRGEQVLVWRAALLGPLVFCALLATVFAFLAQMAAQQVLSPSHTAFIICLEPVFAALWSAGVDGERLPASGYAGAALILAAMLLGEYVTMRCRIPARGCRP